MQSLAARPDLTQQTHAAIREAIVSGDLAPGAPLAQEDLAERLGVSRQPISHALVLLRREGLVVDRGRKGQMVAPIDPDRLLGLYQVRGALDRLAATLAAGQAGDPARRDAAAVDSLPRIVERGRAACGSGDVDALVAADVAFHQALYALSGNQEIARTVETVWPHMIRAMRVVLQASERHMAIWDEHAEIAAAVASGAAERAGALAGRHAETAGEATCRRLREA